MTREEVHLALHENGKIVLPYGHFRLVEAVEELGFVEERCLGRIQILGSVRRRILPKNAAGKSDNAAGAVTYREHDAIAEFVDESPVAFLRESRLDDFRIGKLFRFEIV